MDDGRSFYGMGIFLILISVVLLLFGAVVGFFTAFWWIMS